MSDASGGDDAITVANDNAIDLRLGRWQDALADVTCDALICDPPYSERTHANQTHGRYDSTDALSQRGMNYTHWTEADVSAFVTHWEPRTHGWFCVFTDSELYPVWRDALRERGRYLFAPLACVQRAMNVRLAGDGPSNWTTWLVVARPTALYTWGALQGAYIGQHAGDTRMVPGAKPVWLMSAIIRDYSRPGDLICDPCAGGATTLLAAAIEGRRAIGSEMDPVTYAKAQARIARGYTPVMRFGDDRPAPEQQSLLMAAGDDEP